MREDAERLQRLGDTVNVAARLQSFGDLVLGQTTARQVDEDSGRAG